MCIPIYHLARVAEMTLAAKSIEEMRCFQRSVCIVGATIPTKETTDETRTPMVGKSRPITLAKGIEQFRKMLELMTDTIKGTPTTSMKDFPVIQQVLGRYEIFCKILKYTVNKTFHTLHYYILIFLPIFYKVIPQEPRLRVYLFVKPYFHALRMPQTLIYQHIGEKVEPHARLLILCALVSPLDVLSVLDFYLDSVEINALLLEFIVVLVLLHVGNRKRI